MAAENLKSGYITNRDATPAVLTTGNPGQVFRSYGKVEAAGGDAGSTYRFCSIPSNAKMVRCWFSSDDLSAAGATMNLGLYQTTANGGAVVDADFFASAIDVATAARNCTGSQQIPYIYDDRINHEDVVKALLKVYEMGRDKRKKLGAQASEWARKTFPMDKMISSWDALLQETLNNYTKASGPEIRLVSI
jgi:hypothetical protein